MSFHTAPPEALIMHNGTSVAAAQLAPTRRLPKREMWLPLADDGDYADFQVLARIRYEDRLNDELSSGQFARIRSALQQIVVAHNGWADADTGEPLPAARDANGNPDDGFWSKVAQEELLLILQAVSKERKKALDSILNPST